MATRGRQNERRRRRPAPAETVSPPVTATAVTPARLLVEGEITVRGRLPDSSNATFLVETVLDGVKVLAVYKPLRGERPLWDFPRGLFKREIAAYHLSDALGWDLVPLTVRRDGPFGDGSLQLFVDADFEQHYFTLREDPAHHDRLKRICAFDAVANNADRKSGHCLLAGDGAVFAIDNGLTFHVDPKLRTVIWDFAGEPVPPALLADLERLVSRPLPASLAEWLADEEQAALRARAAALIAQGRFPVDDGRQRRYPWPLV
jgi:uncharacterized repeat protein (TIGR03843 family)